MLTINLSKIYSAGNEIYHNFMKFCLYVSYLLNSMQPFYHFEKGTCLQDQGRHFNIFLGALEVLSAKILLVTVNCPCRSTLHYHFFPSIWQIFKIGGVTHPHIPINFILAQDMLAHLHWGRGVLQIVEQIWPTKVLGKHLLSIGMLRRN